MLTAVIAFLVVTIFGTVALAIFFMREYRRRASALNRREDSVLNDISHTTARIRELSEAFEQLRVGPKPSSRRQREK